MELRYGTADENVRKRSIRDVILHERQKAGQRERKKSKGNSGGTFRERAIQSTPFLFCPSRAGELAVVNVVNRLAEEGVRAGIFSPVILLPPGTQESILRGLMHQICRTAFELGIEIGDVHAEVTGSVLQPVIVGTAEGDRFCSLNFQNKYFQNRNLQNKKAQMTDPEELDIVAAGPVGLEGTCILAAECTEILREKFPLTILKRMDLPAKELCVLETVESMSPEYERDDILPDCQTDNMSPEYERKNIFPDYEADEDKRGSENRSVPIPAAMVSLGDGGFFTGLWQLSQKTGCGLEVDLQAVPVLQETIEITNELEINPYAMRSAGSLLIAARDGERLAEYLLHKGAVSARIGKLTGSRDRILRNGEEIRYLDRPQTDALAQWFLENKIFHQENFN